MIVILKKVMSLALNFLIFDKTLQKKWLKKILREGPNVSKYTVVCIKHF